MAEGLFRAVPGQSSLALLAPDDIISVPTAAPRVAYMSI